MSGYFAERELGFQEREDLPCAGFKNPASSAESDERFAFSKSNRLTQIHDGPTDVFQPADRPAKELRLIPHAHQVHFQPPGASFNWRNEGDETLLVIEQSNLDAERRG